MSANEPISDDLLARYVAGTTTPDEQAQVKAWLAQSADHAQELARFERVWEASTQVGPPAMEVDVEAAWSKVNKRITAKNKQVEPKVLPLQKSSFAAWRVAASVLVVLGLGWLGYRWMTPIEKAEIAVVKTKKNTLEQTLPDGTKVFLNENSTLTAAADFNDETRTVTLKGEAYFDVKRDETRPFIINANGTEVRVLGTSFNVKAYDNHVRVAVTSGKVQFSTPKQKVVLVKDEAAATSEADTIVKLPALNFNEMAYRTRVFVFEKTNLSDVVASLREGYHADIRLSSRRLENCLLTARFEKESLDTTLSVIAETLNLRVVRRGNSILLDGSGCE